MTHLAVNRNVAASTQNQSFSALLFLYREALGRLLKRLSGARHLMVSLLYGSGLRLLECLRLRLHDIDFEMR
ncbi:MAG: phage integrase N-terminal SAM-like domain-containing protein [Candidatus Thiodiazotropha sp.]